MATMKSRIGGNAKVVPIGSDHLPGLVPKRHPQIARYLTAVIQDGRGSRRRSPRKRTSCAARSLPVAVPRGGDRGDAAFERGVVFRASEEK